MTTEYQGEIAGEEWRTIPGYEEEYEASNMGRVRGIDRITRGGKRWKGRVLSRVVNGAGYLIVSMPGTDNGIDGTHRTAGVHRLVAMAFHGEPPAGKKCDVNHRDGDRLNNRPENLEWTTRSENMRHAREVLGRKTGQPRGERHTNAVLTPAEVIAIRRRWDNGPLYRGLRADLAYEYRVGVTAINNVINRITWKGAEYEPAQPLHQGQGNASTQGAFAWQSRQLADISR